jgi:hypothetical protein
MDRYQVWRCGPCDDDFLSNLSGFLRKYMSRSRSHAAILLDQNSVVACHASDPRACRACSSDDRPRCRSLCDSCRSRSVSWQPASPPVKPKPFVALAQKSIIRRGRSNSIVLLVQGISSPRLKYCRESGIHDCEEHLLG